MPNAALFVVAREDHTVGKLMRMCVRARRRALPPPPHRAAATAAAAAACRRELLRDPRVKFAGYKHPHPLDNDIIIRVQTGAGCPPATAFVDAAEHLELEFRVMQAKFADEVRRLREEAAGFE